MHIYLCTFIFKLMYSIRQSIDTKTVDPSLINCSNQCQNSSHYNRTSPVSVKKNVQTRSLLRSITSSNTTNRLNQLGVVKVKTRSLRSNNTHQLSVFCCCWPFSIMPLRLSALFKLLVVRNILHFPMTKRNIAFL